MADLLETLTTLGTEGTLGTVRTATESEHVYCVVMTKHIS